LESRPFRINEILGCGPDPIRPVLLGFYLQKCEKKILWLEPLGLEIHHGSQGDEHRA
jgi:hypothetical protein